MCESSKPFAYFAMTNADIEGSRAVSQPERTCAVHAGVVRVVVVVVGVGDETGGGLLGIVQVLSRQLDPAHLAM